MAEYLSLFKTLATLFGSVFALNLIPAFAPPTWMVMSWLGFSQPEVNPFAAAIVAAFAATAGRVILAKSSHWLIHGRLMRQGDRENIDVVKTWLERKRAMTAGVFLLYAFSPFPSNYLFIAYGLTGLKLGYIAIGFFIGRASSYFFWASFARVAAGHFDRETDLTGPYLGIYFVLSQLALLCIVYGLLKLDWRALFQEHRLRIMRPRKTPMADSTGT
jgi:hypothetical protein